MTSLKAGTDAGNKERVARGIPEMEVVGWVEKPRSDAATQRLIWSASRQDKHATADGKKGVNYNTYALGREGYISMNLVTSLDEVEVWLLGVPILIAVLAASQVMKALKFDATALENAAYYQASNQMRFNYACYYLLLLGFLSVMTYDVHEMLGVIHNNSRGS